MDWVDSAISSFETYIFYTEVGMAAGVAIVGIGIVRYIYSGGEKEQGEARKTIVCPFCGQENSGDSKYCQRCGNMIQSEGK